MAGNQLYPPDLAADIRLGVLTRRRRHRVWLLLACCLLGLQGGSAKAARDLTEVQLKAAFLFNFTKYTRWPKKALPKGDQPLVIGILGKDPFGPALDTFLASREDAPYTLLVRRYKTPEQARKAHLLFVSDSEKNRYALVFKALAGHPVLTVGGTSEFVQRGGMFSVLIKDGRPQLLASPQTIKRAGLFITPKLLSVARKVTP